jgi:hypothetical protein
MRLRRGGSSRNRPPHSKEPTTPVRGRIAAGTLQQREAHARYSRPAAPISGSSHRPERPNLKRVVPFTPHRINAARSALAPASGDLFDHAAVFRQFHFLF